MLQMLERLAQSPQLIIVDRMCTAMLADEIRLARFADAATAPSGNTLRAASELVVGALGGHTNRDFRLDASLITVASGRTGEPWPPPHRSSG
ncbi:MAG: hypothetical protein M3081_16525 [Gemmatimonadota bacterium]|nr:hypothetical protein [Gemmatimonadota bacterium]